MILFYLIGWAIFSQAVLMRFFTCCKRKQKLAYKNFVNNKTLGSPWPILSTHRGGSFERTENTLSAFKHSLDLDIDLLECDVHMTKDGVVLVSHDSDFVRLCGSPAKIAETNFADIPPMKRSIPLHFSDQEYHLLPDEVGKFTTLRELFELAPHKMISIDLKGQGRELIHRTNELIKEFKREHLTIWGSMRPGDHKLIRETNPLVPQFYTSTQVLWTYLLYYTGLLFLFPIPADAFMVPLFTKSKLKLIGKLLARRGWIARFVMVLVRIITMNSKYLYRHLRARGVMVCVWVLNEDEEFEEALSFCPEIDGMMTDCPTRLKEFIKMRNTQGQY